MRRHTRPITRASRTARAAALVAAMAMIAGACGGDDGDDTAPVVTESPVDEPDPDEAPDVDDGPDESDEPAPEPDEAPATTAAPDEPAADEGPRQGGEMVVATLFDSFGFDPVKVVGGIADGTVSGAVFESLMTYDDDANVVPWLAASLETDDFQTWTLGLRPDVEFSDGTPLDAEAVKYNLERHQDISLLSRGILNALNMEEITVADDTTLEIRLRFPWPAFPETLVGPLGIVGSPTALEADPEAFNRNPVGAGPYLVTEWIPGDHITLDRNPNYYGADEGRPYLDRIDLRLVLDTQTRQASVQSGEIHLAQSTNGAEVVFADERGLVGFPVEGPGITIQMNTQSAPFDDVRIRRAALQALDRETIFDVVFEEAGQYPPNNFLISNDSEFSAHGEIDYPEHDPAAAAALVAEYEAEHGPVSFTWQCHTQPDLVNMSQVVQQMWSQAGMEVEIEIVDQQTLVGNIFQRNYEIACFGAVGQEDPDLAFYGTLHSASPTNTVGYENPEVDAALDTGRQSADPDERREAYMIVQQALADDVPLFQAVTSPWGWFGTDAVGGMSTLRNGIFDTSKLYLRD